MKKISFIVMLLILSVTINCLASGIYYLPDVTSEMSYPSYWTEETDVLMSYDEIEKLNKEFVRNNEFYVLIGPGRWGSSDTALGIPVKWPNISAARLIVESSLSNYRIEPSQGTHFFQNLTSQSFLTTYVINI